jgi:hypothetical protein
VKTGAASAKTAAQANNANRTIDRLMRLLPFTAGDVETLPRKLGRILRDRTPLPTPLDARHIQ